MREKGIRFSKTRHEKGWAAYEGYVVGWRGKTRTTTGWGKTKEEAIRKRNAWCLKHMGRLDHDFVKKRGNKIIDMLDGTASVYLGDGKFAWIDSEDIPKVSKYTWYHDSGYAKAKLHENKSRLHRLIMNAPSGVMIDHASRMTLDNRKSNLRYASHNENSQNRGPQKNSSSGVRGVTRHGNKWKVRVQKDGVRYYFGLYDTFEEAVRVKNRETKRLHGKFAVTY